jgi:hypothetical protein
LRDWVDTARRPADDAGGTPFTRPSGPDIDHFLIEHMIDSHGHGDEKL